MVNLSSAEELIDGEDETIVDIIEEFSGESSGEGSGEEEITTTTTIVETTAAPVPTTTAKGRVFT